ncbi:MAG TPA: TatD family hydrolase [Candidatus Limnocylindrales bacterium]|nr:TatD family hydrolase [Candidatus Limnocylindrales bacterium]
MRLVDSHAHLQSERLLRDVDLVVGAARLAGVERILVPGWDLASTESALALCERFPWLDAAAGVHPHDAASIDAESWIRIVDLAVDPRIVAIGETGLDSERLFSPWDAQLSNLRRNLALSAATGKPAIVHCRSAAGKRDAQDVLLGELRRADAPPPLIHSFSGPVDYGERLIALGATISFSGLVFRPGEESSAEVARLVPPDQVLVETDSPFLSPPGAPRKRNEPEWVRVTADWLADVRGEDRAALGDRLVATYDRIIGRP